MRKTPVRILVTTGLVASVLVTEGCGYIADKLSFMGNTPLRDWLYELDKATTSQKEPSYQGQDAQWIYNQRMKNR